MDANRLEHLALRHRWLVKRLGELASQPQADDRGHHRAVQELVDEAVQIDDDLIRMARKSPRPS
ncbi:MAG: hypothetical protein WD535_03840 [Thermaerobacterales bacterium]